MMKVRTMQSLMIYNFGAGPAMLPPGILHRIREDIPNWHEGMSIMEISHRLPRTMQLLAAIEADFRNLLHVPEDFSILFMHGGARAQFSAVPLNLLNGAPSADYFVTGTWSEYAFEEAKKYTQAHCVSDAKTEQFTAIPPADTWSFSENAAYVHYTDNETINGIEFPCPPPFTGPYLVSDMTSNILTREIDFNSFGLIYASAQKNLGIAGITVVIVRKSLLGNAHPYTPSIMNYSAYHETQSMYNTPALFCWYVLGLVLEWAKERGGLTALSEDCVEKSQTIYDVIDSHPDFYQNTVQKSFRSRINVPFTLPTEELTSLFLKEANDLNLKQLKGHALVGGCRASFYNGMPMEGVWKLAELMEAFAKRHG